MLSAKSDSADSQHSEQNTRGHGCKFRVPWVRRCLQFLPYLEPIAGWCRYVPFHRGIQVSTDRHFGDSDVNWETFIPYLPARSITFLSDSETWVCRLLPALHATAYLLNSEECSLLEERDTSGWQNVSDDSRRFEFLARFPAFLFARYSVVLFWRDL